MICKCCNKQVKSINGQHLKKCSNITIKTYLNKYPNSELIDDNVRKSFGLSGEKNNNWQGGKTIKNCVECTSKLSRNNKSGFCRPCSKKGDRNSFFNKKHSIKTKKKMVNSNKDRDKSTYKPGVIPLEKRKIIYENRWKNMSVESKDKMVKNFIIAGAKSCKKSYETKIENKVYDILKELTIKLERNHQIGIYNVDLLINDKFIIECFGDYWHCNPAIYDNDFYNKSIKLTAAQKWEKDDNKKRKLQEKGYKVISFWETDILSNIDGVKNKILKFLSIK